MFESTDLLQIIVLIYIFLSLAHYIIQLCLSHIHHLKIAEEQPEFVKVIKKLILEDKFPSISIIFPIHDEDPIILKQVFEKAKQTLEKVPNLEILFIDDGSNNLNQVQKIYNKYSQIQGFKIIYQSNQGKREAQYNAFNQAKGEILITADSDTLITGEGVLMLVAPLLLYPKVGAVTGDISVANENENLLTKLTAMRYWMAFHIERAAQSLTGSMTCISGPFAAYRREVIEKVKNSYITQTFLGQKCTYGDDRHLTNLVLNEGYSTVFQEGAKAKTFVPGEIDKFYNQQIRWSKSFFRECLWSLKRLNKYSLYANWDVSVQFILIFLYLFALSNLFFRLLVSKDITLILWYILLLSVVSSLKSLYAIYRTKKWSFLAFILYNFLYLFLLVPTKITAILALKDTGWGTRGGKKNNKSRIQKYLGFLFYFIFISLLISFQAIFYTKFNFHLNWGVYSSLENFITLTLQYWLPVLSITQFLIILFLLLLIPKEKEFLPKKFSVKLFLLIFISLNLSFILAGMVFILN
jgi:hyaluronan synthase/N-acetylglucosaminyltransferase